MKHSVRVKNIYLAVPIPVNATKTTSAKILLLKKNMNNFMLNLLSLLLISHISLGQHWKGHRKDNLIFQMPKEWQMHSIDKENVVQFKSLVKNREGVIHFEKMTSEKGTLLYNSEEAIIRNAFTKNFGDNLIFKESKTIESLNGKYWHYASPTKGFELMIQLSRTYKEFSMIGIIVAPSHSFKTMSAKSLLSSLLRKISVQQKQEKQVSIISSNSIVGTWSIAAKDIDLTSGPFGILMAGAASKGNVNANVGNLNAWGSKLMYTFYNDKTYQAAYKASSVFGVFQSYMDVIETGTYDLSGNTLLLNPKIYSGHGYFGNPSQDKKMEVSNLPNRKYNIATDGRHLVLYGHCGEFQIEPYCEKNKRKQNIVAAFNRDK